MEHQGTSFCHSCVKVPVDPFSRQPTPSYERPKFKAHKNDYLSKERKINFATGGKDILETCTDSPRDNIDGFLKFIESIPDYKQINHLTNEQFKQKVEYLKRKQRLYMKSLGIFHENSEKENSALSTSRTGLSTNIRDSSNDCGDLRLNGKKCYIEESRVNSPVLFSAGSFARLVDDQDLLTFRHKGIEKDKEAKSLYNKEIHLANKSWSTWSGSKSDDCGNSDLEDLEVGIETKSLPPYNSKEWHPTVPKPFSFTLREDAEKYMDLAEMETRENLERKNKKKVTKKRRVRKIPITSKIPLYDKLIAEKEERSRIVREESALNLMSQVRPFKLECDRRAWRFLSRSSPDIRTSTIPTSTKFKARPVPRSVLATDIYDRMLEDEYYRQLRKRVRAAELMKSSRLPPSMARREQLESSRAHTPKTQINKTTDSTESLYLSNVTPNSSQSRSALSTLPVGGTNLAAILRCQASREKLERKLRERMDEERREHLVKYRESLIGQKPAWRALRSSARHEPSRDIDIRASIRREEAREQAERHRLQMEMMLDRVTRIPTLFERYSQSFQSSLKDPKKSECKKKMKKKMKRSNDSIDSFDSNGNNSRPTSGSLTSSTRTLSSEKSSRKSSKSSSGSRCSEESVLKLEGYSKRKNDRGPLKVSINEKAELIEDKSNESSSNGKSVEDNQRNNNDCNSFE
ncbi:protein FAM161A [Prorops nasuta]|uniref:protein FAM161A n=1 Tax=Prorops nasuta TaxID=863751 RepID=UPI0034CDC7C1